MAQTAKEVIRWLRILEKNASVAIDDGGLQLVEVGGDAWLEIGGIPADNDDE